MLALTVRLLRADERVAQRLRSRHTHVLVDEFQVGLAWVSYGAVSHGMGGGRRGSRASAVPCMHSRPRLHQAHLPRPRQRPTPSAPHPPSSTHPPQDCNPLQVELALLLGGPSGRLTAVGDAAQSIFGFTAATPRVFELFSTA